jgi:putative heme iron utilization protein
VQPAVDAAAIELRRAMLVLALGWKQIVSTKRLQHLCLEEQLSQQSVPAPVAEHSCD